MFEGGIARYRNLLQLSFANLVPQRLLLLFVKYAFADFLQIDPEVFLSFISRLLLFEVNVILAPIRTRKVTFRVVEEAGWVRIGKYLYFVVFTIGLFVEADVVVLPETVWAVEQLRSRPTPISATCALKIAVPTLPQKAHLVIDPLTKLGSAVCDEGEFRGAAGALASLWHTALLDELYRAVAVGLDFCKAA